VLFATNYFIIVNRTGDFADHCFYV
jgi:hypothetical protein